MEEDNKNGRDRGHKKFRFELKRSREFRHNIFKRNMILSGDKVRALDVRDVKDVEDTHEDMEDMEDTYEGVEDTHEDVKNMSRILKYCRDEGKGNYIIKVKGCGRKNYQYEKNLDYALEQSLKSELLLTEESGYMENEDGETYDVTQDEMLDVIDPSSASKRFDLVLKDHGPYRMNYSRNGRYLLLGGEKGHVAAIDWVSKKLMCEMNVKDSIYDVAWLHQETLYAVAQKKWLYVYDNKGIEIHCVKQLSEVFKLVYLPYHYLLTSVSSNGWLSWLDVTTGTIVKQINMPPFYNPASIAQHPGNALICIGQSSGIISFWSPNLNMPALTKWCHDKPISALAFDPKGHLLATSFLDSTVKLWDARNLRGPIKKYKLNSSPNGISFSENGLMALGIGKNIEIYKDHTVEGAFKKRLYLTYEAASPLRNMEFCPCEDILGIAHTKGFSSILVPGSGQANFDALETNPFLTKSQRREREIQGILTKIPHTLIAWDPNELRRVHINSLQEGIQQKKETEYVRTPRIIIEPRYKVEQREKLKNATETKATTEQLPKNDGAGKVDVENQMEVESGTETETETDKNTDMEVEPNKVKKLKPKSEKKGKKKSVLDRFKPKPRM